MCFACANCRKQLDSTNATEHDDELFCKSCYGKKFDPKATAMEAVPVYSAWTMALDTKMDHRLVIFHLWQRPTSHLSAMAIE